MRLGLLLLRLIHLPSLQEVQLDHQDLRDQLLVLVLELVQLLVPKLGEPSTGQYLLLKAMPLPLVEEAVVVEQPTSVAKSSSYQQPWTEC